MFGAAVACVLCATGCGSAPEMDGPRGAVADHAGGASASGGSGGEAASANTGGVGDLLPGAGGVGAAGATSLASGGSFGAGGASAGGAPGSGGAAAEAPDIAGTWVAQLKTDGALTVPVAGRTRVHIDLVSRLVLANDGDTRSVHFEICRFETVTFPDANQLKVKFTPAVVATMIGDGSTDAAPVAFGGEVPLPDLVFYSGQRAAGGSAVDSDNDGHAGITIPASLGGLFDVDAYAGVEMRVSLHATLEDATTTRGTTRFSASGVIFGSNNPLLNSGDLSVVPDQTDVPFVATRFPGNIPCSEVLKRYP